MKKAALRSSVSWLSTIREAYANNRQAHPHQSKSQRVIALSWIAFKAMSRVAKTITVSLTIIALLVLWAVCDHVCRRIAADIDLRRAQQAVTAEVVANQDFTSSEGALVWSYKNRLSFDRSEDDSVWTATKYSRQEAVDAFHQLYLGLKAGEHKNEQARLMGEAEALINKEPAAGEAGIQIQALNECLIKIEDAQLVARGKERVVELEAIVTAEDVAEKKRLEQQQKQIEEQRQEAAAADAAEKKRLEQQQKHIDEQKQEAAAKVERTRKALVAEYTAIAKDGYIFEIEDKLAGRDFKVTDEGFTNTDHGYQPYVVWEKQFCENEHIFTVVVWLAYGAGDWHFYKVTVK